MAASRVGFRPPARGANDQDQARFSCHGRQSCPNPEEAEQGTARDPLGTNELAAQDLAGPGQYLRPARNPAIATPPDSRTPAMIRLGVWPVLMGVFLPERVNRCWGRPITFRLVHTACEFFAKILAFGRVPAYP